jgi:small subunit ribosomal protein S17
VSEEQRVPEAEAPGRTEPQTQTQTPAPSEAPPTTGRPSRGERKVRTGVVVSDKMDKTVLVRIEQVVRHRAYGKTVRSSSKLAAHDESNDAHVGDTVRVMETRPLSRTKRWRVVEVLERAK